MRSFDEYTAPPRPEERYLNPEVEDIEPQWDEDYPDNGGQTFGGFIFIHKEIKK